MRHLCEQHKDPFSPSRCYVILSLLALVAQTRLHPQASGSLGPGLGADVRVSNLLFKFHSPRKGSGCCSSAGAGAPCDSVGQLQREHHPRTSTTGWSPRLSVRSSTKGHTVLGWGPELLGSIPEGSTAFPLYLRVSGGPASGRLRARADGAAGAEPKVSTEQLLCVRGVQSGGWKIPTNPAQPVLQKQSGNVQTSADAWVEGCSPQGPRSLAGSQPAGTVLRPPGQEQSHSSPLRPMQPPGKEHSNLQNSS